MTFQPRPDGGKEGVRQAHGDLQEERSRQREWPVQRPWGGNLSGVSGSSKRPARLEQSEPGGVDADVRRWGQFACRSLGPVGTLFFTLSQEVSEQGEV